MQYYNANVHSTNIVCKIKPQHEKALILYVGIKTIIEYSMRLLKGSFIYLLLALPPPLHLYSISIIDQPAWCTTYSRMHLHNTIPICAVSAKTEEQRLL